MFALSRILTHIGHGGGSLKYLQIFMKPSRLDHHAHAYAYITSFVDLQSFKIALKICLIFPPKYVEYLRLSDQDPCC